MQPFSEKQICPLGQSRDARHEIALENTQYMHGDAPASPTHAAVAQICVSSRSQLASSQRVIPLPALAAVRHVPVVDPSNAHTSSLPQSLATAHERTGFARQGPPYATELGGKDGVVCRTQSSDALTWLQPQTGTYIAEQLFGVVLHVPAPQMPGLSQN